MRWLTTFTVGALVAVVALHGATPARADHAADHGPSNRIQVEILRVHVLDDSDALSDGELTYRFRLQRGGTGYAGYWCTGSGNEFIHSVSMSATTSQVRGIYDVLGGDRGLALYQGDEMRVSFAGVEEDWDGPGFAFCPVQPAGQFDDSLCGAHDKLGVAHFVYSGDYGLGQHSKDVDDIYGNRTFRVDYEIRQAPLPELRIVDFYSRPAQLLGGQPFELCVRIRNVGLHPATERFLLYLWLEGSSLTSWVAPDGLQPLPDLDHCLSGTLSAGTRRLGARIDHYDNVAELNESNNEELHSFTWSEPPQPIGSQRVLSQAERERLAEQVRPAGVLLPRPPSASVRTSITTDRTQYRAGEPMRICYTAPGPGPISVVDVAPDGRSKTIRQATDDGTGDCFPATVSPPAGKHTLRLEVFAADQPKQVAASAETSFTVLP
jgi:hypothetical protein